MGDKYKVKKSDLRSLFATAEMMMVNRYHDIYQRLDWKKGANGNFSCWNVSGHTHGVDAHPSLSVDNQTGKWHCFTCGIKGNFQSYWKEYLKGHAEGGESYTDFIIDFLNMSESLHFSTATTDPDYEKNSEEMRKMCIDLQNKNVQDGRPFILPGELTQIIKEASTIPMATMDTWVDNLLTNPEALKYLYDTRRLSPDIIKKFRIGMNEKGKFIFPIINGEGSLINVKAYDPRGNPMYKWSYPFKGYDQGPSPINHFTHQIIHFFGGEPDMYCAIAMGVGGAVTFGSEAITDVDKVFGQDRARQIFLGKEIVICLDADDTGIKAGLKLAASLYPYAKQIKVIDLNKSDINKYGLDPEAKQTITVGDKTKEKRTEKDFTDFMKKNGFDETAKIRFKELIERTTVYTQNVDRIQKEIFKVTLQESRMPKYYSSDGSKILELTASVSDFNSNALFCPSEIKVNCRAMGSTDKTTGSCKNCQLPSINGFETSCNLTFHFLREVPKEFSTDPTYVKISEHDILGLVEVTESQKNQQIRKLCQINDNCKCVVMSDGDGVEPMKLLHVRLVEGVNDYGKSNSQTNTSAAEIDVEAYMVGANDIYPNKSYKFEAVQTTAWNGQHAVLFIHKAEPIATCIETFKMDQQTHEMLQVFKPKEHESIKDHLDRRYDIFANAAGVSGRREIFLANDLAFFSAIEINNDKMLPGVKRGWVEILIAGDTRTCKTMISKWLRDHYKIGDIVVGSTAVSRSGLLGGTITQHKKPAISWGKIPMNDGGLVIIDELSNISLQTLDDLTGCRSSGVATITGIASGSVLARTRKIMLSNQRTLQSDNQKEEIYGVIFLKNLCYKDEILARFDFAFVVRRDDVDVKEFSSLYTQLNTEFTEFQCQNLIRWVYSRKPEQIIFENGFEEMVNQAQIDFLERYHASTQLINQEMRAKLVRMSVSLASLLYSTPEDDWNKILVKKEHLSHIIQFLNECYCHKNMKLDEFSAMRKKTESLGSMAFMENICKYIDIDQLLNDNDEFSDKHIQQIFYDYLERVSRSVLYIVDSKNDNIKSFGQKPYESVNKLINLLTSRNCFVRTKRGMYRKTKQFNEWLLKRMELGDDAPTSDILELESTKQNPALVEAAKKAIRAGKQPPGK